MTTADAAANSRIELGVNEPEAVPELRQPPLLELEMWEVQLLELTISGHTRESTARRLGVSERTVRRRLQAWCEQVGASDITQLAAWLVEVQLIRLPVSHSRICLAFTEDKVRVWGEPIDARSRNARFGAVTRQPMAFHDDGWPRSNGSVP